MKWKILDVIKYEKPDGGGRGPNQVLVWKHPSEDFNTSSTLIVHESQCAVFFKNGQIADVFHSGRYILKTENLPVLRRIMNLPTGGETTFHCEVYFVNLVEIMSLKWGTDSKVQFIEPNYNSPMEIGASGEMSLRVREPAAFLVRLVGTEREITPERLVRYFRGLLMSKVKSYLARFIKEQNLNIFEIDSQLDVLSDVMKDKLVGDFAAYGIDLVQFFVSTVVRPEDDPEYQRLRILKQKSYTDLLEEETIQRVNLLREQGRADRRRIEAMSLAEKRRLEGYTYQEEKGFEVARRIAENENIGEFSNLGLGMGLMAGVGGAMGVSVGNMVGNVMETSMSREAAPKRERQEIGEKKTKICACGTVLPLEAKFCHICGKEQSSFCHKCGSPVVEGANFCSVCGEKL